MAYIGTGLALCIASQCTNHTGLCIDTWVQLLAPPANPATQVAEKIPFNNPQKPYCGCQQCVHKY